MGRHVGRGAGDFGEMPEFKVEEVTGVYVATR